jgi:hypothetical protein
MDSTGGNQLQLLDYSLDSDRQYAPGDTLELLSKWEAEREFGQGAPPLRIFLHLVDEQGEIVAQHDALDVRLNGLYRGDRLAQLHALVIPGNLLPGTYGLQIGLYDATTGQRMVVDVGDGQVADRILLETINVAS